MSPELVEISAGHAPESRWAQPFDAAVKDVFAVQADIADRVATAMQGALGSVAAARIAEAPTRDPAAYDAFLRGEAILNAGQGDARSHRRALAAYDEALGRDSTMALAWARRSGILSALYIEATPSPELAQTALAAAERAIALDSTRIDGYLALATYHRQVTRDLGQERAAVARARALAPQDDRFRYVAAGLEENLGQLEAARRDYAEAARLDPRNDQHWGAPPGLLLRLGRVAEARTAAEREFARRPSNLGAIHMRAMVEAAAGDVPAARQVLARAVLPPAERITPARDDMPSIAVLPFANMSGNADQEYFSDGMAEEVINSLARLPRIRIAAWTSSFAFKGQSVDLRKIADQLKVRTILEGSVRRAGTRVRIAVQLADAATGLSLWSERYDRELADVFELQDEIGQAIAGALAVQLGSAPALQRCIERRSVDPAALDLYLRGRFLFENAQPIEALGCFERAVQIDPDFALAHAGVGMANVLGSNLHMLPALTAYPRARIAAERARALDPTVAEGYFVGAAVALWFDHDIRRGEALARQGVEVAPGMAMAHEWIAWAMVCAGRFDEAVVAAEHSLALDPLSEFMLANSALIYVLIGRPERAIDAVRPVPARSPGNGLLQWGLGFALLAAHRLPEALSAMRLAFDLLPIGNHAPTGLCEALAALGDMDGARTALRETEARAQRGHGSCVNVGIAYHALGDDARALEWLERAVSAREFWTSFLHLDPRLRRLRDLPRFAELVREVGIAEGRSK